MKDEYFESDEFKEILDYYECHHLDRAGFYLDIEDFADVSNYYVYIGENEKGLEAAEKGIALHGFDCELMALKANAMMWMQNFDEAQEIIESLDPSEFSDVLCIRGQLKLVKDNDIETADGLFKEWIKQVEKEDADCEEEVMRETYIHVLLSYTDYDNGLSVPPTVYERWIDRYIERFKTLGDYEPDLVLADISRRKYLHACTERIYSLLLETKPYLKGGWTDLATAQFFQNKYSECIESAEFALTVDPEDAESRLLIARSYYAMNMYEEAYDNYMLYDKMSTEGCVDGYVARCLIEMGRGNESLKHLKVAEQYLERVFVDFVERSGSDMTEYVEAYLDLAYCYYDLELYDKAIALLDKAVLYKSDDPFLYELYGYISLYAPGGSVGKAEDYFMKAVEYSGRDAVNFILRFGHKFTEEGYYDEAVKWLKSAFVYGDDATRYSAFAYLAYAGLCSSDGEMFLAYLRLACGYVPGVVKSLFQNFYPPTLPPEEYYNHTIKLLKVVNGNVDALLLMLMSGKEDS